MIQMRTRIVVIVEAEPLILEGWEDFNLCVNKDPLDSTCFNVTERWTGMQLGRARLKDDAIQMARKRLDTGTKEEWKKHLARYRLPEVSEPELQVEPVF